MYTIYICSIYAISVHSERSMCNMCQGFGADTLTDTLPLTFSIFRLQTLYLIHKMLPVQSCVSG